MTTEQKQNLLAFLGYYGAKVDGIWGDQSQRAMEAFQADQGMQVTGTWNEVTEAALLAAVAEWKPEEAADDFWDEIEFFDREEFKCTCGGRGCNGFPAEPAERLVRNADAVRKHFGRPAIVSSGVRCALRNSELPDSAANSLHMRGKAMDFGIPGEKAAVIVAFCWTLPEVHECYAIDEWHVHMGVQKY